MGHAGAIVTGSAGTAAAKAEALEAAGVRVARTPSQVAELVAGGPGVTSAGAADAPVPSFTGDLAAAAPVALAGGAPVRRRGAPLGQVPPLLVNIVGGGLAVSTQVRLGWLTTMAAPRRRDRATGSAPVGWPRRRPAGPHGALG